MPRIKRSTLLISIAIMLAVVAVSCEAAAVKPTAEPPTPIPTVGSEHVSEDDSTDSALSVREALSDPEVLECLSEQLGGGFDASSGAIGPELLGRLGPQELAMLEDDRDKRTSNKDKTDGGGQGDEDCSTYAF